MMQIKKDNNIRLNNKGFTLVELLISVTIISIASIGIIQAFTMAGITNGRAQKKQNATSLAESVMEEIKSSSIAQLKKKYNPTVPNNTIDITTDDATFAAMTARNKASTASGLISGTGGLLSYESAKPNYYVLCRTGAYATNNSDTYTVTATMRTKPYSETASGATPVPDASDANSIKLPVIEEIDTHSKTVLSINEINKYDVAAQEHFKMHSGFIADGEAGALDIKKKEIIINKTGDGSAGGTGITVKCQIRYTATDDTTTYIKDVFNGTYVSQTEGGAAQPVNNGIYIFYNRFLASNETIKVNDSSTNDEHKVYVIFQNKVKKKSTGGLESEGPINNLSGTTITLNDGTNDVFSVTTNGDVRYRNSEGEVITGRKMQASASNGDYWLITNLPASPGVGVEGDFSEKKSKNRLFEVTVEVTKPDDDTVYATLTSTVYVRD